MEYIGRLAEENPRFNTRENDGLYDRVKEIFEINPVLASEASTNQYKFQSLLQKVYAGQFVGRWSTHQIAVAVNNLLYERMEEIKLCDF